MEKVAPAKALKRRSPKPRTTGFSELIVKIFLVLQLSGCVSSQRCPIDWTMINSRCYFLSSERKTWEESRQYCRSEGADLVVINSEQEQRALYRLNGDADLLFWIGLKNTAETFKWVDGSVLENAFWLPGQPDYGGPNNKEDCVEMYHRHPLLTSWNDAPCGHELLFLCEKDPCSRFFGFISCKAACI